MPEGIADKPELNVGSDYYYVSFWELCPDRPSGFGPAAIPGAVVRAYCQDEELTDEETEEMKFLIRSLDVVWLSWADDRKKAQVESERRKREEAEKEARKSRSI